MPASANKEDEIGYPLGNIHGKVFATDCHGKLAVLGGQKSLFLINLDDCSDERKFTTLQSDHKAFHAALWSPKHPDLFMTTSNEIVDLWEARSDGGFHVKSSFHGHTRPVCNMDWSPVCNNHVATCSMDCFTYVLDTRDFKKPSLTLQSLLPPSLVRWNKVKEMVLATAHEGGIEIWDLRNVKQARPSILITAHNRKINDFDWCPNIENQMVTCSMDSAVKIWDVHKPKENKEYTLNLNRTIIRVKYTPFGNAMVTQCSPQELDADLYMWKLKDASTMQHQTIHLFPNSDNLTNWCFRKSGKDFQLVAWSSDKVLMFWKIDPYLRKLCDSSLSSEAQIADEFNHPKCDVVQHPETLAQEFELLSDSIPNIIMEKKSAAERLMRMCAKVKKEGVKMELNFPPNYPNLISPVFELLDGTSLDLKAQTKLLEELKNTAKICVQSNRCCIEPCLRVLISFLENIARQEPDHVSEIQEFSKERLRDENVPFPRTSGARFCGPGFLVCFTRRMWMEVDDYVSPNMEDEEPNRRKNISECSEVTPRAMSALAEINAKPRKATNFVNLARSFSTDTHIPSISLFFAMKDQEPRIKNRYRSSKSTKLWPKKTLGPVIMYDLSCLLPIQKQLGECYVFDSNPFEMCQRNAQVALTYGRKDLYQVWSLVAYQVAEILPGDSENPLPLIQTPFGKSLIKIWYDHYCLMKDVQTLAMLCCVFSHLKQIMKKEPSYEEKQPTIVRKASISRSQKPVPPKTQRKHSNSFSESVYDTDYCAKLYNSTFTTSKDVLFLETLLGIRCNSFIRSYSNILFQWGFVNKRADLLNFLSLSSKDYKKTIAGSKSSERCSLCQMPVYGPYVFCFECGHGGHVTHLSDWFVNHNVCPTGCGCICMSDIVASL